MIKIYTDAATKNNPGPTGLGALIVADHRQIQLTDHVAEASNHTGEFLAAQMGFVLFFTDSRLLSDAVGKNYSKHYADLLKDLNKLMQPFATVVTQWIPEAQNHGAHHLANQALHQIK